MMRKGRFLLYLFFLLCIPLGFIENLSAAEDFLDRGIAEYKSENYEEALELFLKAREQQPGSSSAAFYLGLTHKQMGSFKEAVRQFKDAIHLTPPFNDAYPELIETLYSLNEIKEAKDFIKEAEREKVKPGRITFLRGLIFLREGMYREAIGAFKKAKEIDRSLSQTCDLQIAMAYTRQRRFAEAKETLRAVISIDPASEMASFAKEYEIALTRSIEGYKPWNITAGLAYQFDDNVIQKPSEAIPGVVITGERDSSVITYLRLSYTPLLREPWFFNAQYHSYTNTYFDNHKVNLISQTVSLIPGYGFNKGMLTLPTSFSYIWLHEKEYMSVILTKPTVSMMLLPNHIGQFSVGYARREMLSSPPNHDRNEERDGNIYSVSPGYVHTFLGGKGVFNLRYELSDDDTEGKNWENLGNRFSLSLLVPIIDKLSFTVIGEIFLQDYQHTHTFFGMKRSDRTYYGAGNVKYEILKGLSLNFQYSHTRADSNIDFYEYKRNTYTAGVEYTF